MHNESSQIDELFRKASQKAEQEPVEGDWDALKGKLFKGKPAIYKTILWSAVVVVVSGIMVGAALYFSNTNTQKALVLNDRNEITNNPSRIQNNDNTQTQEASSVNNSQNTKQDVNNTNQESQNTEKTQIRNSSNPALPYKVQVGAFKNKPSDNFYSNLGNLTVEEKDGYYKYYAGEYDNPAEAEKKLNELKTLGYNDAFVATDESQVKTSKVTANKIEQDVADAMQQQEVKPQIPVLPVDIDAAAEENQNKNINSTPEISLPIKTDTTPAQVNASNGVRDLSNKKNIDPLLHKWGVGAIFSYDVDKYHISENNDYGAAIMQNTSGLLAGSNNLTYTVGLQGTYRFSNNWSVETGLLYLQKKQLTLNHYNFDTVDYSFDYNGKYLDIPLRARYYFLNNPVKLFATAGAVLSSNFPVKNKGYFRLENQLDTGYYETVTIEPTSVGVSMQFGAGVEYILQKKVRLYLMPIYNYSFSPVLKHPTYNNEPVKHFIRSINISAGVYFDF